MTDLPQRRHVKIALLAGLALIGALALSGCAGRAPDPAATPTDACATSSTDPLLLMTFNIRVGYGDAQPGVRPQHLALAAKDLAPIVTAIRSVDPDVLALQEVLTAEQGQRIAEALGMHHAFASHLGPVPLWGVSVLSKCPITAKEVVSVSDAAGNKRRALVATVEFADKPLDFASLHADPDVDLDTQLERVSTEFSSRPDGVIVMGDFNVPPDDAGLGRFTTRFVDTALAAPTRSALAARERGTVASKETPKRRIDYILVPRDQYDVLDAGLSLDHYTHVSDHRGYYALVRAVDRAP